MYAICLSSSNTYCTPSIIVNTPLLIVLTK